LWTFIFKYRNKIINIFRFKNKKYILDFKIFFYKVIIEVINMGNKIEICYDDKLSYVGQMKNQKFDGEGTLYYNDTGDLYKGNFKDGMKHGLGELQFYSGDKYIGEFFQDQQHGKGKYISNNGYIYNGNFSFGTLLGDGEIRDINNELIYKDESCQYENF
jgi:hypothetical protein